MMVCQWTRRLLRANRRRRPRATSAAADAMWSSGFWYPPDLIFVDSLGDQRDDDLDAAFNTDALVVVHDANHIRLPDGVSLTAGRGVWIGHG